MYSCYFDISDITGIKGINVNIESNISDILAAPLIMLLFVAIILPLQIKYGAEKSRVTLLVVVGIIAALIFVLKKKSSTLKL